MTFPEAAPRLAGLDAALDAGGDTPNFPALGMIADELDVLGLPHHAECYRWCMTAGRWPASKTPLGFENYSWWSLAKGVPEPSRLSALHIDIVRHAMPYYFRTASAAFATLAEAWAAVREKGLGPFPPFPPAPWPEP